MTGAKNAATLSLLPQPRQPSAEVIPLTKKNCIGRQPIRLRPLWVQLPDIHPVEVFFQTTNCQMGASPAGGEQSLIGIHHHSLGKHIAR
jgi:hypothetical protein